MRDRFIDEHPVLWGALVLRRRRESLGIARDRLAAWAGVHSATIRNLECGRIRKPDRLTLRRLCNALSLPMPGDEGLYLCLDGIAAEHLRCVVIEALAEYARRRRDPRLFGALVFPNATGRFRRARLRRTQHDRDLAHQLLALLQPDGNSLVAEVFVAPPVARRRSRLPSRRLPCPLPRPPRPHG